MAGIRSVAEDASARAAAASLVATQQTNALDGLSVTSRQLAELSDRLRQSVSRFAVTDATVVAALRLAISAAPLVPPPSQEERSMAEAVAAR